MEKILLVTPPFTQLNTPYPATAYIKGFLNTKNIDSFQMDLGIEVILDLFSKNGLRKLFAETPKEKLTNDNSSRIFALQHQYISIIDEVISFLQGNNHTIARLICSENYLPQASRFDQLSDMEWAFGSMGIQDKAKHLATLFLEDIADFITDCIDSNFGFSRYAERLGMSANSFDELYTVLQTDNTFIDKISLTILTKRIESINPPLICFSVPFPGNLYSAFRCAQYIKKQFPHKKTALGGGFPNTELRSLKDQRVMEFFDYISLDDGELPLELIISQVHDPSTNNPNHQLLKRTWVMQNDELIYNNFSLRTDYKQEDLGTPDYSDLLLDSYISVIEVANPMHSLWSDGKWLKLTMAHGCYWGKCTFCDVSLDYIGKYEPITAKILVDRMEQMIQQTGERGFHFVDEAAPPALMRELALEILRRDLQVRWWTNIRFEKSFNENLCRLLQASGCIAISGGLEVASDRLLALIQKGVTVEQVAQVTRNFTASGIMVHAYLMYAYPTQTIQETIDSLEMVRQLFEQGIIQSGFWHQFALTTHSPVGKNPDAYGIIPHKNPISFADNDVDFTDKTGIDHNQFSFGLKKSLYNYMHGICFEEELQFWFDFPIPVTTITPSFIENVLEKVQYPVIKPTSKLIWLGPKGVVTQKKGCYELTIYDKQDSISLEMKHSVAVWLADSLEKLIPINGSPLTYRELQDSYNSQFDDFTLFWYGEEMEVLKEYGLLVL